MFEVGEYVKVKDNADRIKGALRFTESMRECLSNTYKIIDKFDHLYNLENVKGKSGLYWYFCEEWLEYPTPDIDINENELMEVFK